MASELVAKITKMDRRHTGHELFMYYVHPAARPPQRRGYAFISSDIKLVNRAHMFNQWRVWCWETWGPGTERDNPDIAEQAKWAWHTDQDQLRIYFRSEQELNWFKLRWQ